MRNALILIVDPLDQPTGGMRLYNIEETLIHELLHLHFAPLDISESLTLAEEQAINAIARALVNLKNEPTKNR